MFYIKENEKIILVHEDKNILSAVVKKHYPLYKNFPILETKENEVIVDFKLMTTEEAEQEKIKEEAERIGMLNLTAADVERGIYVTRKMDFEDVINKVIETGTPVDIKALKIELRANHFYRGNPFVDQIGTLLGYTKEQLDRFFETGRPSDLIS